MGIRFLVRMKGHDYNIRRYEGIYLYEGTNEGNKTTYLLALDIYSLVPS